MEILNNIWNVLSTENELLIKLNGIPSILIETYLFFGLFTQILKISYTKRQKHIYILSVATVSILCSFFIPEPYNLLINYLFMFVFLKYYFRYTLMQSVLAIIMPFCIFGLVNSLFLNPFLKIFNISYESSILIPIYRIPYLWFIYLILFFITILLKKIHLTSIFYANYDKKTLLTISINLVLGLLTLVIQAFLTIYCFGKVPIVFTLFNFGLLFAYFFTSFYSLTKAMKLDITTRDLENAESYNNSLTVLYDNVKGFKHDFDNIVNSISGYIQVDDMDGLKKYFSTFQKECDKVRNVQMLNPNVINNPAIYNLLVSKYKKATDLDVKINFEFFFDFENLKMPIYEFSRILGILLDNAIEAAKDCDEKQINLVFRESRKQSVQIIVIENTYLDKDIDTKKIYEKGISGKENHSGIGLWEVNKIIMKYNHIALNTTKNDKYFRQELQIYF